MNSFWHKKNVLITGHTGFKGSWLSIFLKILGCKLYGLSISPEEGIYKLTNLESIFEKEFFLDLGNSDTSELTNILNEVKPEIVFHFAAQAIVSVGYNNPINTYKSNILGTLNILLAIEGSTATKSVVVATTDKVYKNNEKSNSENSTLGGSDSYSLSKVSIENIVSNLNKDINFKTVISIVRSGNVLGGGDRGKDRITTDIVNSFLNNKTLFIRNLNSIRPWQYVLDSIYGYILVAEETLNVGSSQIYNLNSKTNNKHTVEFLINQFQKNFNSKINVQILKGTFKEKNILLLDSSKARTKLNWNTETKLEETISKIVKWEIFHNKLSYPSIDFSIQEVVEFIKFNSLDYSIE